LRFFLEISYNGKNYHGWQTQPHDVSIQQVIEEALATIFQRKIEIVGAGRTDAGVHARQLFAHFDLETTENSNQLVYKLNAILPVDIAVHNCFQVKDDAHARFDAQLRTYRYYLIWNKNPFLQDFAYRVHKKPEVEKMNQAAQILLQYTHFQCFSKSKTDVKTYLCKLTEAYWEEKDNQLIFTITADRFLRNMVRAIVGTLLEVGFNNLSSEELHQIIASKNRSQAGKSVPAQGLFLEQITYPECITKI
jgi:tRNA pseudouridine38-40 synthase